MTTREEEKAEDAEYDVCQGCGCYFPWGGIMRQKKLWKMGVTDGPSYQRCYECL